MHKANKNLKSFSNFVNRNKPLIGNIANYSERNINSQFRP